MYFCPFGRLTETELASDQCLAIPFFPTITAAQVSAVCRALKQAIKAVSLHDVAVQVAGSRS